MLIGICGKARSGKDTVAEYLKTAYDFETYPLAEPLKNMVMDLFQMSNEQMYGKEKEVIDPRYDKSPRWLLQYLGTDVFRKLYNDIWIDLGISEYKHLLEMGFEDVVIPDVRFINEFEAIKRNGGYVWKTVREGHTGASSGIEGHRSETELDVVPSSSFDHILSAASGQISFLHEQADEGICKIRKSDQMLKQGE
jgi:hypothetical protein